MIDLFRKYQPIDKLEILGALLLVYAYTRELDQALVVLSGPLEPMGLEGHMLPSFLYLGQFLKQDLLLLLVTPHFVLICDFMLTIPVNQDATLHRNKSLSSFLSNFGRF
jgi:hypothetical protein